MNRQMITYVINIYRTKSQSRHAFRVNIKPFTGISNITRSSFGRTALRPETISIPIDRQAAPERFQGSAAFHPPELRTSHWRPKQWLRKHFTIEFNSNSGSKAIESDKTFKTIHATLQPTVPQTRVHGNLINHFFHVTQTTQPLSDKPVMRLFMSQLSLIYGLTPVPWINFNIIFLNAWASDAENNFVRSFVSKIIHNFLTLVIWGLYYKRRF